MFSGPSTAFDISVCYFMFLRRNSVHIGGRATKFSFTSFFFFFAFDNILLISTATRETLKGKRGALDC